MDEDNGVYYRILARDGRIFVAEMQWFDEIDYNPREYIGDKIGDERTAERFADSISLTIARVLSPGTELDARAFRALAQEQFHLLSRTQERGRDEIPRP